MAAPKSPALFPLPCLYGSMLAPLQFLGDPRTPGLFEAAATQVFGPINALREQVSSLNIPNCIVTNHGGLVAFWARGIKDPGQGAYFLSGATPSLIGQKPKLNTSVGVYATILRGLFNQLPGNVTSVVFIGHSFGGAAVQALCAMMQAVAPPFATPALVVAGSPKPGQFGSVVLPKGGYGIRMVNYGDFIPFLPPSRAEAPLIYKTLPLPLAAGWNDQDQPAAAAVIGNGAPYLVAEGDPSGTDISFLISAIQAGVRSAIPTQHSLKAYLANLASLCKATQPPLQGAGGKTDEGYIIYDPPGLFIDFPPRAKAPTPAFIGPFLPSLGVTLYGENMNPTVIPPNYQFTYDPYPGAAGSDQNFVVTLCGYVICFTGNRDQAKRVCKYGNHLLKRMQISQAISPTGVAEAWPTYLALALSGAAGFSPTPATSPVTE